MTKIATRNVPIVRLILLLTGILMSSRAAFTEQPAAAVPPEHFHHLHLNSVNPSAAIEILHKSVPEPDGQPRRLRGRQDGQHLPVVHESQHAATDAASERDLAGKRGEVPRRAAPGGQ